MPAREAPTLSRFRAGRWQRDRVEATCPPRHRGRIEAMLWTILKVRDVVPSEAAIRRAPSGGRQHFS
jgi:hypothetical protein